MASRHGGSKDHRNMDDGQGRSRGNPERQLRQHQKPRHHEATTDAAPVYITIGPQCCGKSSFLKEFKENTIKDISLDDQRDVYVPIQTETFLHAYDAKAADDDADDKQVKLLQRVYHGKTLAERIRENIELILILRRWNDDSTAADFERRIKSYYEERKYSESVALKLIEAVEEFLSNKPSLPKRTDVFVLESLFKPHPEIGQSAIKRSYEELRETPRHIPVAWGNTNSKTKDYEKVLEICHQKRRPLHFIVCHPTCSRQGASDADNESELLTLPWLPFEELLKRNLNRLQSQGRFVPSNAIADCCQRVTALIPVNIAKSGSTQARNKIVEEHLVAIATGGRGPHRHGNRHPTPSFRYSLTKHRLIQKEYTRNNDRNRSSNNRPNNQNRNYRDEHSNRRDGRREGRDRYDDRYDDRPNNRRRYGNDHRNGSDRPQGDQGNAQPRSRRRYND